MDEPMVFHRTNSYGQTATSGLLSKPKLELCIGSNIFRSTNGVIKIQGKEQLVIEINPEQRGLFTTLDLYNEQGIHIAHLRRNAFLLNENGRFAVDVQLGQDRSSVDVPSIRVTDQRTGDIILEVHMASENRVSITCGKLYSHKGALIDVTPHYCRISSDTTRFGDIVEARGGPVTLG